MSFDPATLVAALADRPRVVLAVSGGLDSMALLEALAARAPDRIAAVATFDHGTGVAASRAVRHVLDRGASLGLPVVTARAAEGTQRGEAAWRAARWGFLREVAALYEGAPIATAHTRDDQIETVLMRALRRAGTRGLAGLAALSPGIVRPLLAVRRVDLERWALANGVGWIEDPSNHSLRHLRNRVRHQLLPALRAMAPDMDEELLGIGARAAAWRADLEALLPVVLPSLQVTGGAVHVASADCAGYDYQQQAILWPALAAQVGLALDRRGTERIARFITSQGRGRAIQLAGGWELVRARSTLTLRRAVGAPSFYRRNGAASVRSGRPALVPPRASDSR